MKRVVSVSLGSSKRDKTETIRLLGEEVEVSRQGTDGDLKRFAARFRELDGKVDALGIGGADLYLVAGDRRYTFRQIAGIVRGLRTSVVDGSGLKNTLEREAILRLQREGTVDFRTSRTLLVSSVDRFGMAEALAEIGGPVVYGDLLYGLGLPFPVRSYGTVKVLAALLLPVLSQLPIQWLYPTGAKQEARTPKHTRYFEEANVIAGDWHFIRRFAPERLPAKTILTQTLRAADFEMLRQAGVARAILTTPEIGGESFATNVMEAALTAVAPGKNLADLVREAGWGPTVKDLAVP